MKETRFKINNKLLGNPLYLVYDVLNESYDLLSSANIGISHKVWFDQEEVERLKLKDLGFQSDTFEREI